MSAREIEHLYQSVLDTWNQRDAEAMAALFAEDGSVVGFDGSQMNGRDELESTLREIFSKFPTACFHGIVREVRFLEENVALLRAVVGMVPRDSKDINPDLNAIQSLVACRADGDWKVALYQNTPAQFHGRPELAKSLTEELRQVAAQKEALS